MVPFERAVQNRRLSGSYTNDSFCQADHDLSTDRCRSDLFDQLTAPGGFNWNAWPSTSSAHGPCWCLGRHVDGRAVRYEGRMTEDPLLRKQMVMRAAGTKKGLQNVALRVWKLLEREMGFEPTTLCLGSRCSTPELLPPDGRSASILTDRCGASTRTLADLQVALHRRGVRIALIEVVAGFEVEFQRLFDLAALQLRCADRIL